MCECAAHNAAIVGAICGPLRRCAAASFSAGSNPGRPLARPKPVGTLCMLFLFCFGFFCLFQGVKTSAGPGSGSGAATLTEVLHVRESEIGALGCHLPTVRDGCDCVYLT